jgi:peptidyl-Lys metalloendopeptidase
MKGPLKVLPAIAFLTVLAGAIAAANAAPERAGANPLRVGLYPAGDGTVEVVLTNTSARAARVPRWQLPQEILQSNLFSVTRDGKQVAYEGALIKRGLPQAKDFAILRPGQTYRTLVDLAATYDMRERGDYTVSLASPLQYASLSDGQKLQTARGLPMLLKSPSLRLWHDGGVAPYVQKLDVNARGKPCNPRKEECGGGGTSSISFVGCDATQASTATNAVNAARNYSENAKGYLATGTVGPRYSTWFGAYTSQRYATARTHFVDIDAAMDQNAGQIKINCGCNQSYYAYVYPTRPYEIFVCRAFWSAPLTGTDSKAGTLIHEMSHFNVVAGTDDIVYGQSGAKSLASSDPDGALNNADNHEYFAENTPSQN